MKKSMMVLAFGLLLTLALSCSVRGGEIHDAAEKGDVSKVKSILQEDSRQANAKDKEGKTPLDLAIEKNKKEIANFLRKHGGVGSISQ